MVWYSHLFQNFPQFIVIHTVKDFGIVNKAEIDVFWGLSCFFHDPADVGNLIPGSSALSKTSLNMWKFKCVNSLCVLCIKKLYPGTHSVYPGGPVVKISPSSAHGEGSITLPLSISVPANDHFSQIDRQRELFVTLSNMESPSLK